MDYMAIEEKGEAYSMNIMGLTGHGYGETGILLLILYAIVMVNRYVGKRRKSAKARSQGPPSDLKTVPIARLPSGSARTRSQSRKLWWSSMGSLAPAPASTHQKESRWPSESLAMKAWSTMN